MILSLADAWQFFEAYLATLKCLRYLNKSYWNKKNKYFFLQFFIQLFKSAKRSSCDTLEIGSLDKRLILFRFCGLFRKRLWISKWTYCSAKCVEKCPSSTGVFCRRTHIEKLSSYGAWCFIERIERSKKNNRCIFWISGNNAIDMGPFFSLKIVKNEKTFFINVFFVNLNNFKQIVCYILILYLNK